MEEKNKKIILGFVKKTIYFLSFFVLFFIGSHTRAATLYFSPDSGTKQVGKNFSISIFVSASDQSMNAASGELDIPTDKLEVVSVSKSGSIFSLWAQEPSFSAGSVNFEGVVLNPGYTGSAGKIITVTLKAKAAGQATIRLSSGSVLANDGNGTNILKGLGSANFVLTDPGSINDDVVSPPEVNTIPNAPKVSSINCPPPDGWCAGNDPKFSWILPPGTTGVSILGDHNPNTNPGTKSDGVMSSYTYSDVEEGSWYFHIRVRNSSGWGPVTHYQFQIDTQKPDFFDMSLSEPINSLDPVAQLYMKARDGGSEIGKYEIVIDNGLPTIWFDEGGHIFRTEPLDPGMHTVVAKAIDKAGNYLTSSLELTVNPIDSPNLVEYPQELFVGQNLVVLGNSYPDVTITFYLQKDGAEAVSQSVKSDENGNFKFIFEKRLAEGEYSVWARAQNEKGAKSNPSEKIIITSTQRALFRIGSLVIGYATLVIALLGLVILLLVLVLYIWHKFRMLKNKVRTEVEVVEKNVHTAFDELRESTRKQVSTLERVRLKRELTKEEAKILSQLKNQLNAAEKFINKEVGQIEKGLK
ncbi:MAG: hypothetical protein KBC69_02405 [Candidatus Magasanikbacteria bacterium]|nr:hypothetical protein [Candidatus Magasanikbacteria bacterium]